MQKPLNATKVRTITFIGNIYYGWSEIDGFYYICIQKMGDRGWLVKHGKYYSHEAAIAEVKRTEKEHYNAKRQETEAHTQIKET